MIEQILKLGDPRLYEKSDVVTRNELAALAPHVRSLHELILECRKIHGFGRGIAAPQIGLMKRLVCLNLDGIEHTLFNPRISDTSQERFELWDDCMSFPGLLVKVARHRSCSVTFEDSKWETQVWKMEDDLSELLQHECDHLDGILATQRAIDDRSFRLNT